MATEEVVVRAMLGSVDNPVFTIIPSAEMGDEGYVKLYRVLEEVLLKIEDKADVEFDIMIDSADSYGGYNTLLQEVEDQRLNVEHELYMREDEGENNNQTPK